MVKKFKEYLYSPANTDELLKVYGKDNLSKAQHELSKMVSSLKKDKKSIKLSAFYSKFHPDKSFGEINRKVFIEMIHRNRYKMFDEVGEKDYYRGQTFLLEYNLYKRKDLLPGVSIDKLHPDDILCLNP